MASSSPKANNRYIPLLDDELSAITLYHFDLVQPKAVEMPVAEQSLANSGRSMSGTELIRFQWNTCAKSLPPACHRMKDQ